MVYIDFDGVILDTENALFKEWRKNPNRHLLSENEKIQYIKKANWDYILNNSNIINDSLYYLNNMDSNKSFILTKVHSMENEAYAKVLWLRKNNVKQGIIVVPYYFKKSDIVSAKDNVLIDDSLKNLKEWEEENGYPIFFNKENNNIDRWNEENVYGYKRVLNLSIASKYNK